MFSTTSDFTTNTISFEGNEIIPPTEFNNAILKQKTLSIELNKLDNGPVHYFISLSIIDPICNTELTTLTQMFIPENENPYNPPSLIENDNELSDFNIVPNPVNDIITINLIQPETSYLTIELCDLTGNCITTLLDEICNKGPNSFNFNLTQMGIASGSYIIKITSPNTTLSKQFIFTK